MERQLAQLHFSLHLAITKRIVPATGEERKSPGGGAKHRQPRRKIPRGLTSFIGDGNIRAFARELEPFDGLAVVMQDVIDPAEFQHDRKVHWIVLMRNGQIPESVLHVAGLEAFFTE